MRQIQLDLDPRALQSRGVTPQEVGAALANQTQITPAGFVKIGEFQYNVRLNNAPGTVDQLNALPVRFVNGSVIRIGDVAHVRDGSAPQQNVVHVDGQPSVLMTVLKSGATLDHRDRRRHQADDPAGDGGAAERAQDTAAGRPVDLREGKRR